MDTNQAYALIGSLGFPIVVCIYLIRDFRKTIEALKETIQQNTNLIERVCKQLEKGNNNESNN